MSKFTAPTGESPLDGRMAEVSQQLQGLREALSFLRHKAEQDSEAVGGQIGKVLAELRQLLRLAMETESKFEERRKAREAIVSEYRLDLDEARATIGRRLDRLRGAGSPGGVSERSD